MVHWILTKTLPKRPWTTNSQRTQWLTAPHTATHTSLWYRSNHAHQVPNNNYHKPSRDPRQNHSRTIREPQSKSCGYSSTQHKIFLWLYSTEKNPRNKYFRWPSLKLWPRGPQYYIPITSNGWCPQVAYTLYLHDAPKNFLLSKNGIWGHLGITNKPPSTRPGTRKRSSPINMGHIQHTPYQLSEKIRPWCSLQILHFRRHNKARRLLLRRRFQNSSDRPISPKPYRRYSQTLSRRPQHLCRGRNINRRKSQRS